MKKILLFLTLFTGMTLTACNDSFLEKYPVTSLTEEMLSSHTTISKLSCGLVMKCFPTQI